MYRSAGKMWGDPKKGGPLIVVHEDMSFSRLNQAYVTFISHFGKDNYDLFDKKFKLDYFHKFMKFY